ncbi:MAG: SprT-like domain-containing protein [Bacteroidota bacterium]
MTSKEVFDRFVPPNAVGYCNKLYIKFRFEFKIKRARQTKLGDYRYHPKTKRHTITINNDLNPYAFLVTYLHEVAHLVAFSQYGRRIQPHGKQWKQCFKEIAQPLLTTRVFPESVLGALISYFKNPKASSCADPELYKILKQFDASTPGIFLQNIQVGKVFIFNNKTFIKLEKKRTRSVCKELKTGRMYLISELAEVQFVN